MCVEEGGGAREEGGVAREERGGTREVSAEKCQFLPRPDSKTKESNITQQTLCSKCCTQQTLSAKQILNRKIYEVIALHTQPLITANSQRGLCSTCSIMQTIFAENLFIHFKPRENSRIRPFFEIYYNRKKFVIRFFLSENAATYCCIELLEI